MANSGEILFVSRETPDDETRRLFENRGFQLTAISDFAMASNSISQARFSAIVVDVRVGSDAINLIRFVRQHEQAKTLPLLAIGEWGTGEPTLALSAGADGFEPTPLLAERLATSIERLLIKRGLAAGAND